MEPRETSSEIEPVVNILRAGNLPCVGALEERCRWRPDHLLIDRHDDSANIDCPAPGCPPTLAPVRSRRRQS